MKERITTKDLNRMQEEFPSLIKSDCFALRDSKDGVHKTCNALTEMLCVTKGRCPFYKTFDQVESVPYKRGRTSKTAKEKDAKDKIAGESLFDVKEDKIEDKPVVVIENSMTEKHKNGYDDFDF